MDHKDHLKRRAFCFIYLPLLGEYFKYQWIIKEIRVVRGIGVRLACLAGGICARARSARNERAKPRDLKFKAAPPDSPRGFAARIPKFCLARDLDRGQTSEICENQGK